MRLAIIGFVSAFAFAVPHLVAAQDAGRASLWAAPGAAFSGADAGPSVGGALTIGLSPWIAVEGTGVFLNRGSGANGFNLQAAILANLLNKTHRVVPYITGGVGMYRASLDLGAPRFFGGRAGQFGPGTALCGGTGVCPYGEIPAFYARRLGIVTVPPAGAGWPTRAFTDPAFHVGAGTRIEVAPRLFLRPELRGLFVVGDGDVHSLGAASVAFGYRF
jgi:hypothetical protein